MWMRVLLLWSVVLTGCTSDVRGPVVFLTDFGRLDDAVSVCKGVMLGIEPKLTIVDLTHNVPPQNLQDASRFLAGAADYYPKGTTFVVVVDPGVGTERKAIVVRTKKDQYFVVPDNGVVSPVVERDGFMEAREITNPEWMISPKKGVSSTFHGRDIFSPAGAMIASGKNIKKAGPLLDKFVTLTTPKAVVTEAGGQGIVVGPDGPYGNLITNFTAAQVEEMGYGFGGTIPVRIGKARMELPFKKAFNFVAVGKPLAYIDSKGFLAFAVNQGNFSKVYGLGRGLEVQLVRKK